MTLRWNKPLLLAYRNIFLSPDGQKVLADLRKKCPTFDAPVGPNIASNVNVLLLETGANNVLKHIYKMLRKDPNAEAVEAAITEVQVEGL